MTDAGTPDSGMPDSGTPDSGTPDSGTPDSGTPDSGTPDSGSLDSGVDPGMLDGGPPMNDGGSPLGEACTGSCPNGYLCYAADDEPPGICVPPCQEDDDCPSGYECSSLDVCVPAGRSDDNEDATPGASGGCTCRTAGHSGGSGSPHFALFLLAVTLGTWRRRSNKSVRTPA
jgi:MYXO-CTERM domain-containing protein